MGTKLPIVDIFGWNSQPSLMKGGLCYVLCFKDCHVRGGTKKVCLTLVYRFFCPLKMPATNLIKVSMLEIAASITNSTIIYHVSFKILECLRQVFVELIQEVCVFIYLFIVLSFIVYFLHVLQAASSFKFSFIYSLQTVTVILKLLF